MYIHPQESSEARAEIGKRSSRRFSAAASTSPQPDSPARCDLRGSHSAEGRSASAEQHTRRILAESGPYSLELEVAADADLEGEFVATDISTGERLFVKGWMIEHLEELDG